MAALLNSLSFAYTHSFLPKYRVEYYNYIIKWCSGISCNWCVSMDIDKIVALTKRKVPGTKHFIAYCCEPTIS